MEPEPAYTPEELASELLSASRTSVGDSLRSITYFDEDNEEQLYLRSDLEPGADLVGFADNERLGFHSQVAYQDTELGNYQFTIRVFERGFLTRVIVGDHGCFVTTDEMPTEEFEELASAVGTVLGSHDPP
ncbi:DUF7522 family protein [Halobacterium wangiae]|uniref:DUF7522 family protein n=1 Tax=Halobacterium wangiae TaxID=2902623 RepID=UPI001E3C12DA|nr:hypothetical protein [Halobacterium wangiae]